jgi:hypothetical protein
MGQKTSAAIGGEPKEIDWRQHLEVRRWKVADEEGKEHVA